MTPNRQVIRRQLLWACMACAPVRAQGQGQAQTPRTTLASLVRDALALHPATQSQRALVASAAVGVGRARWQFDPTPPVSLENATTSGADPADQGNHRVASLRLQLRCVDKRPRWLNGAPTHDALDGLFNHRIAGWAHTPSLTQRVNKAPPRPAVLSHSMAYT
jgi:hypothetical protein